MLKPFAVAAALAALPIATARAEEAHPPGDAKPTQEAKPAKGGAPAPAKPADGKAGKPASPAADKAGEADRNKTPANSGAHPAKAGGEQGGPKGEDDRGAPCAPVKPCEIE